MHAPLASKHQKQESSVARSGNLPRSAVTDEQRSAEGQGLPLFLQARLAISQPDDPYEQEADRVADSVMRMAEPSVAGTAPGVIQRKCAVCEEETENIQTKLAPSANAGAAVDAGSTLHVSRDGGEPASALLNGAPLRIQRLSVAPREEFAAVPASVRAALTSSGSPLAPGLRQDMEQRFGCDFSRVRVHSDAAGERSARDLQAYAYTQGNHIVFGTGQYAPSSGEGRRLLAHELTHVVQQSVGTATERVIQRSPVYYRKLTWQDFQGSPVEGAPESAGILSLFEFPGFTQVSDTVDTKKKCGKGKAASTLFKVTRELDPAQADSIKAYMDPAQSWLKKRFQDDGTKHCTTQAATCEADFDQSTASAGRNCDQTVKGCEDSFKTGGKGERVFTIGEKRLILRTAEQCRPMLSGPCQKELTKDISFPRGSGIAKTKADCRTAFFSHCKADEKVQKDNLLKHEQGHFDITNELAKPARAGIKAKAATVKVAETKCGEAEATKAATESFDMLHAEFKGLIDAWTAVKEKAQNDYDGQTGHGVKAREQKDWEDRIKAGLKNYDPTMLPRTAPVSSPPAPAPVAPPAASSKDESGLK